MASCNNCSLKEKEQVYTAARDGNLMYMKVSVGVEPFRALCSRKPTRSIRDGLFVEPWTLLVDVLFILIRFSEVSVCVRNSAENFIDFDSICRTIVTFNAGAKIKISRWIRFWKNLSKISLSVIKNVFFSPRFWNSSTLGVRSECFYYQHRRLSLFTFLCVEIFVLKAFLRLTMSCKICTRAGGIENWPAGIVTFVWRPLAIRSVEGRNKSMNSWIFEEFNLVEALHC